MVSPTFEIITGYDEVTQSLIGWHAPGYISDENANTYLIDDVEENGMFIKHNWNQTLSRIIVITDTKSTDKTEVDYINYWIHVMEKTSNTSDLFFVVNAFAPVINLLEDDNLFENIADKELKIIITASFIDLVL